MSTDRHGFMGSKRFVLPAMVIVLGQWSLPAQRTFIVQKTAPPQYREQPPFDLKAALGTTGNWKALVTAAIEPKSEFDSDEGPSQSRICFERTAPQSDECAYFRDLFHSKLTFQALSSLSVERLRSGNAAVSGLAMKAAALFPTGQLHETAIWAYDRQQDRFHLAIATESTELRIFSSGRLNGYLVTADWHRDDGASRWSDHRRDITLYRLSGDGAETSYRKALDYTSAKKYGAEDTGTIDAELASIEAKLP